jgi:enamine deaminase RidA (YjgF/YER057c/UK114 family)
MSKKVEVLFSPKVGRGYSTTTAHGTKAAGFVFVTGQVAVQANEDGLKAREAVKEMGEIGEQTRIVMENVKSILEEAGTSLEHCVKRNIYLTHPGDFDEVHKILEEYFKPMATTCVITQLVPPSSRIEIDVIAVVPN